MLKKFFLKDPYQRKHWILLALIFKPVLFIFFLSQNPEAKDFFSTLSAENGDTRSYLDPVDHLVQHGSYEPDFRMPGYGAPYYLFLQLFSKPTSMKLLLLFQLGLSVLAVYYLALSALLLFNSYKIFYGVFYLYLISTYTSIFDISLLTESLTVSSCIFSAYFFIKFFRNKKSSCLFCSGVFMMWMIFLRPVFSPLLVFMLVLLVIIFIREQAGLKSVIKNALIFVLPFMAGDGIWIIRNFTLHKKFIPLQTQFNYPGTELYYIEDIRDFVMSWGGDRTFWEPKAEIRWFGLREAGKEGGTPMKDKDIVIPSYIYTSRYSYDSLLQIREYVAELQDSSTSKEKFHYLNLLTKYKLQQYIRSIKSEKPFLYYIKAPALLLKKFLFHSGTYNLFLKPADSLSKPEYLMKVFYSLLYLVVITFGIAGALLLISFNFKWSAQLIMPAFTLFSVFIFPCLIRQIEYRYFVPAYPFTLVCAVFCLNLVYEKIKVLKKK
jgi:hypothetical protein